MMKTSNQAEINSKAMISEIKKVNDTELTKKITKFANDTVKIQLDNVNITTTKYEILQS